MAKKAAKKPVKPSDKATPAKSAKPANPVRIGDILGRFHALLFTLIVGGGLTFAVYLLMMIVSNSDTPDGYQPPSTSSTFDTQTIEQIETLRPLSSSPSQPNLPAGRIDPFVQ